MGEGGMVKRRGGRQGRGREPATHACVLSPTREHCPACGQFMRVAYLEHRTVVRLDGVWRLTMRVRRCRNAACQQYHRPHRPEEAGAWALPQAEFGLDVVALVGHLRYREQRSVPQIHEVLQQRNVQIAERSVTELLHRYEELVALRLGAAAGRCGRSWPGRVG